MKNYPIIKSNEAVTVLFTASRSGYVLDYNDDHYKDILYKSDWSEGAFSEVGKSWFKGKCIVVDSDSERDFVRELIFNISGVLFAEPSVSNAKVFYVENCRWCHTEFKYDQTLEVLKQLHIPFDEIFNDTTVTTELKGAPPALPSVKDRYRACVKLMNDLLAENERNNGNCVLNEKQVWVINELINTSQLLIDQKLDYKYIVNHVLKLLNSVKVGEVNIGNLYDTINNLLADVTAKPVPAYDYESIVNSMVGCYNLNTTAVIGTDELLDVFERLVTKKPESVPAAPAPAPTTVLEAGSIMTMLAQHFNKPIGVRDIEPTIEDLISTKSSNPKLIELVESFRTQRDLIMIDKCSPATRIALEKATDLCNEVTATFNGATTETPVTPAWLKTKLTNQFNRTIGDSDVVKCIDELISGYNTAAELQERYDLSSHDKRTLNEIIQLLDGTNDATVDASNVYETVKNVFTQWEMFGIAKPASKTPLVEWKETHEVKIGDTWFQVEPVFVSEVEMFFYDPRPTPPIAPTNSVRQSNVSVINLNSPDYRNNEIGYLCIDDDGVLHPYDPESPMIKVKLCKNIL